MIIDVSIARFLLSSPGMGTKMCQDAAKDGANSDVTMPTQSFVADDSMQRDVANSMDTLAMYDAPLQGPSKCSLEYLLLPPRPALMPFEPGSCHYYDQ